LSIYGGRWKLKRGKYPNFRPSSSGNTCLHMSEVNWETATEDHNGGGMEEKINLAGNSI